MCTCCMPVATADRATGQCRSCPSPHTPAVGKGTVYEDRNNNGIPGRIRTARADVAVEAGSKRTLQRPDRPSSYSSTPPGQCEAFAGVG
jgi:hypothetical protein